jgi:glyoxylase-like metal-dependent hydrolase (beta-lactamase superfamily II)
MGGELKDALAALPAGSVRYVCHAHWHFDHVVCHYSARQNWLSANLL